MRDRLLPLAVLLIVVGVVLPLVGALGTRFGAWRFVAGFGLLALGVLAALAALILALIAGWTSGRWGVAAGVMACSIAILAVPVSAILAARGAPPIHDISTDTANPPPFNAVLALRGPDASPAAYDGDATARQQLRAYPDVKAITIAASPHEALLRGVAAARTLGWTIVGQDPGRGTFEATDTTFWFGFTDDIVIRVSPAGDGARIDVRSKSRVGIGDLGANARRIRAFMAEMRRSG